MGKNMSLGKTEVATNQFNYIAWLYNELDWNWIVYYLFLTAASCPKKDVYTPPQKTCNRLLYCALKKVRQKAGPKKLAKKSP